MKQRVYALYGQYILSLLAIRTVLSGAVEINQSTCKTVRTRPLGIHIINRHLKSSLFRRRRLTKQKKKVIISMKSEKEMSVEKSKKEIKVRLINGAALSDDELEQVSGGFTFNR